jgi:exoribonuclease R
MQTYQVNIYDRNYTSWELYNLESNSTTEKAELLNPLTNKLFDGDTIEIVDDRITKKSGLDNKVQLEGVLILEGNKTFGRTPNKKRLYYRCIPNNKKYPVFLVPYDVKVGFSKRPLNKYVLFNYSNWTSKHPIGELTETIGDVNNLEAFYEYQLHCRKLHTSIKKLTNHTNLSINKNTNDDFIQQIVNNPNYLIEDRTSEFVFSIDPNGSKDFDDAFSIDKQDGFYKVSVYIANVYVWMEALDLWEHLTDRVSTIYLPDKKRTMLPTILSDSLCSLQENELRIALSMDIYFDKDGNQLKTREIEYTNVVIKTRRNFVYEEKKLLKNSNYKEMMNLTKLLKPDILDSHELVEYWMIRMNTETGNHMAQNKSGIFRKATYKNDTTLDLDKVFDKNTSNFIKSWNNTDCKYVRYEEDVVIRHDMMSVSSYVHITSPIRRIVDLLNQIIIMQTKLLVKMISSNAKTFLMKWLDQLDALNENMKSIRKVQTDCQLLFQCNNNKDWFDKTHSSILFGKTERNDGYYSYTVYISELNVVTRIKTEQNIDDFTIHTCQLFTFNDEEHITNKIKCQLIA